MNNILCKLEKAEENNIDSKDNRSARDCVKDQQHGQSIRKQLFCLFLLLPSLRTDKTNNNRNLNNSNKVNNKNYNKKNNIDGQLHSIMMEEEMRTKIERRKMDERQANPKIDNDFLSGRSQSTRVQERIKYQLQASITVTGTTIPPSATTTAIIQTIPSSPSSLSTFAEIGSCWRYYYPLIKWKQKQWPSNLNHKKVRIVDRRNLFTIFRLLILLWAFVNIGQKVLYVNAFQLDGSQSSFAQFRKWYVGLNGTLELEFKTEQPNGLVLYTDDGGTYDFFELKLVEGALRLRYNLGGGAQIITVGRELHDGHWHKVQVSNNLSI